MDIIIVGLVVVVLLVNIALFLKFKSKPNGEDNKDQEVLKIKDDINSLKNSLGESFNNMSKEVAKDMTAALTKVDEKVGNFNQQVQLLNQSQEGITKILAGVKKYGTLAEYSLGALMKDLLPTSQFMTNVKMKEDTSENVEFAIKLQGDVLVPVDSHFPAEKFKAITDAHEADDKKAAEWFKLARYEGRNNREPHDSIGDINLLGWNFYMPPEQAARGIEVFNNIKKVNKDSGGSWKYKDLSNYTAWKGNIVNF